MVMKAIDSKKGYGQLPWNLDDRVFWETKTPSDIEKEYND